MLDVNISARSVRAACSNTKLILYVAGGKQFRLGTTYADVESARKMYLAARRVLVRVTNGL